MLGITPSSFVGISDDVEFSRKLLAEENVFVLPGAAFGAPNYVRLVFCAPKAALADAAARISAFCARYAVAAATTALPKASERESKEG